MLEYLTKEYEIQLFNKNITIPDMIRYYLETNINEEAFYIIHINNIINS